MLTGLADEGTTTASNGTSPATEQQQCRFSRQAALTVQWGTTAHTVSTATICIPPCTSSGAQHATQPLSYTLPIWSLSRAPPADCATPVRTAPTRNDFYV
jgi:hypothetical protein